MSGRVAAADTGRPVRGAIVHIVATSARNPDERQGLWVTTDADGLWALADLQPGGFTVSDPGTPAATEARRISLRMGQEAANTNFNLSTARYASVSGTVVGSSGAPVGATVTLRTADASDLVAFPSVSATAGAFTIPNVAPGDYRIQVHTAGGGIQNVAGVMEFAALPNQSTVRMSRDSSSPRHPARTQAAA